MTTVPTDGYGPSGFVALVDIGAIMAVIDITVQLPGDVGQAQTVVDAVTAGVAAITGHLATEEPEWGLSVNAVFEGRKVANLLPEPDPETVPE